MPIIKTQKTKLSKKKDVLNKIKTKRKDNEHFKRKKGTNEPIQKKKKTFQEDEITSDEEEEEELLTTTKKFEENKEEELTAEEKRVLNAQNFLENIKSFEMEKAQLQDGDETKLDEDPIAVALKREILKKKKKISLEYASQLEKLNLDNCITYFKGHKKTPTCISLNSQLHQVFTGSKDRTMIHWDLLTGKKISITKNEHPKEITCCSLSSDGSILATGSIDNKIRLFDTKNGMKLIDTFEGHFKDITGLAFQLGNGHENQYQLYSSSKDRTVKVWDAKELSFVDTLYGHENEINSIDTLVTPNAVTCSNDGTCRYWKVYDESQLIYSSSKSKHPIDCIKMLKENVFISGSQDGHIYCYNKAKKKPLMTFQNAHGGNWIHSIGCLHFSDVFASGSGDGYLKLWQADIFKEVLQLKNNIPIPGFINGIEFNQQDASYLVCCIGQEHRLGKWWKNKQVKNGIAVVKLFESEDCAATKLALNNNSSNLRKEEEE
ncbi:hypothetical protein ABK040_013305 [Willaertia magna]